AHRGGCRAFFRGAVAPVEDSTYSEKMPGVEGMLALVREGGDMRERFERFCRTNLCMESWDFIIDAAHYEVVDSNDPDEQFKAFERILDQYLLPTSPDEINISSTTSKHMASLRTREAFDQLDGDARVSILKEPLAEIVRMLEQNLWS
ncbi:unnamed protein product, partial [Ectocarpus fasciculatus]